MTDAELIEKLSAIFEELTDILLERTPEGANWEDCEPEIDNARHQIYERREELYHQGRAS